MNFKYFFLLIVSSLLSASVFGQAKIYTENQYVGQALGLPLGATQIDSTYKFPKSIQVEPGTVVVLYEKYIDGKTSGRHRLITSADSALVIRFYVAYAIVFSNPNDDVMGFEEPNFGGESVVFKQLRQEVPVGFGLSSIYVPKGKKVKLYWVDPKEYPDQEVDHRPIAPGIRPYIGADIDNKIRFIDIE